MVTIQEVKNLLAKSTCRNCLDSKSGLCEECNPTKSYNRLIGNLRKIAVDKNKTL